jgi:hypothetical protein
MRVSGPTVSVPDSTATASTCQLETELPTGRVRVHGSIDVEVVRPVLESLRR